MKRISPILASVLLLAALAWSGPARALSEQQELIDKAVITVEKMAARDDIKEYLKKYLRTAKGVVVFPSVLKAGFFVGGKGGSGVLLARGKGGKWSYPAFYTMGAASFGLQFGGSASETMLIIMTAKGLTSIIENKVKLGGELSAAVGPYGVGVAGATSTALGADVITYSVSKGAFIGGAVEGAVIEARDELNQKYYNDVNATPEAIVLQGRYSNPKADRLRAALAAVR